MTQMTQVFADFVSYKRIKKIRVNPRYPYHQRSYH